MDDDTLSDLLRRLTALVIKLDERNEALDERNAKLDERNEHILTLIEEQREFNKQQVEINAELKTLMQRVFEEHTNGHA